MNNAAAWTGIIILSFAGTLFYQSLSYEYSSKYGPGPGLFPFWLCGLLIVLSIIYIISSFRKDVVKIQDIMPKGKGLKKVLMLFAAVTIFLVLIPHTGFSIASLVMLFMLFFGEYKWYSALGLSALVTFSVFYIFKHVLSVPLPINMFGF